MSELVLKVKRLVSTATLPTKSRPGDAGWDLHATGAFMLCPGGYAQVYTGIATEIPPGWYAQVRDRSSLAAKGITTAGGVIDAGYRGEWIVLLFNRGGRRYDFDSGDRIAQFTLHQVPDFTLTEVAELPASDRGYGGFGSTGR